MKYILIATVATILSLFSLSARVSAEPIGSVTSPEPPLAESSVMVTAYRLDRDGNGFVQLHNSANAPINVDGWTVAVFAANETDEIDISLVELTDWIEPKGHIVIAAEGLIDGADVSYALDEATAGALSTMTDTKFRITPPASTKFATIEQPVNIWAPLWSWRKIGSTGNYLTSFDDSSKITDPATKDAPIKLTGGGSYSPPIDAAGLTVVEIYANAKNCSPFDMAIDCNDYVKLYNGSLAAISLEAYLLRSDSGGSKSSISNAFPLSGVLEPGAYMIVNLRRDNDPMSLTNSGGFVWFEDVYGLVRYDSAVAYNDVPAGMSWAFDGTDMHWRPMAPQPIGANYWPQVQAIVPVSTSDLSDCGPGRERNPDTNRCRTTVVATSQLSPCPAGQERNPETNRCRSTALVQSTLVPCGPGQERNPETNRCRSVKAATTALAPCPAGQERNPETNRCRKTGAVAGSATIADIQDIESTEVAPLTPWYITGVVVVGVVAYGFYEWRQELGLFFSRFKLVRKR